MLLCYIFRTLEWVLVGSCELSDLSAINVFSSHQCLWVAPSGVFFFWIE